MIFNKFGTHGGVSETLKEGRKEEWKDGRTEGRQEGWTVEGKDGRTAGRTAGKRGIKRGRTDG